MAQEDASQTPRTTKIIAYDYSPAPVELSQEAVRGTPLSDAMRYLPYVNMETLSSDATSLLGLLQNRIRHDPQECFAFDYAQLGHLRGFRIRQQPTQYMIDLCRGIVDNPNYVTTRSTVYGELVSWNKSKVQQHDIVHFVFARLALLAQRTLLRFLSDFVQAILKKQSQSMHTGSSTTARVAPSMLTLDDKEFPSSYLNQPFSAPSKFDPSAFLDLIASRHAESVDHIWLIQTDPYYVTHVAAAHAKAPMLCGAEKMYKHMMLTETVLLRPLQQEYFWRSAMNFCHNIAELSVGTTPPGKTDSTQAKLLEAAMTGLQSLLDYRYHDCAQHVLTLMVHELAFHHHFSFTTLAESHKGITNGVQFQTAPFESFIHDPLCFAVGGLSLKLEQFYTVNRNVFFKLVEYHTGIHGKQKHRLSQRLYLLILDMAFINQLLTAIEASRSRACVALEDIVATPKKYNTPKAVAKSHPAETLEVWKLYEPVWSTIRDRWHRRAEQRGMSATLIPLELELLSAGIDEKKQAEFAMKFTLDQHNKDSVAAKLEAQVTGSNMQIAWGGENVSAIKPLSIRQKTKTRPSDAGFDSAETATEVVKDNVAEDKGNMPKEMLEPPSTPRECIVGLKAEHSQTLEYLFPRSGEVASSKVRWERFVAAMDNAGFRGSLGDGSAMSFKSSTGSIVFHRPHPGGTIEPYVLLAMGKRMHKHFGWHRDMFP